jgi:alpha-ketoglutarate-dependent taurine dioxygenase
LKITDIKPLIGSVVEASQETLLNGKYALQLRELLEERGVLVFPKIGFDDEQQVKFTETLGEVAPQYDGAAGVGGDLVMWDNIGALHRARPYDPAPGRLMHRTMLAGDEPFA